MVNLLVLLLKELVEVSLKRVIQLGDHRNIRTNGLILRRVDKAAACCLIRLRALNHYGHVGWLL